MKSKKAISLIVLVITIIVMIILASAIIISLGNVNIFNKAEEATDKYTGVQEKQKIQIAVLNAAEMGGVNETNLTKTINEEFNEDWDFFSKSEEGCVVRIKSSQRRYEITTEGKLEEYEETELADKSLFTYNGTTITGLSTYGKETLTALAGKNVKLVIPEGFTSIGNLYINNKTVFDNIRNLSVEAPDVTSMREGVFSSCKSLVSIYAPNIIEIGMSAFVYCSNLTNVYMPKISMVSISSFANCANLTNIDISGSTNIGYCAFSSCTSLKNINLPNVETVVSRGFINCTNLTSIDLPLASNLGDEAFYGCKKLVNVNIENVKIIGARGFVGCANLVKVTTKNLEDIGPKTFYGCTNLTSIDLSKVTAIGEEAFLNCENLNSIDLTSMVNLGFKAFYFCNGLRNIKFSKLESVGGYSVCFIYNGKITVNYTGTTEEWNNISIDNTNTQLKNAKIICSNDTINE